MRSIAFTLSIALFSPGLYAQGKLQISPPPAWKDGWKLVSEQPGQGFRVMVFVPPADAAQPEASKDSITIMETSGGMQEEWVRKLYQAWGQTVRKTCSRMFVGQPTTRTEDGFTTAYAQFYCPKRNGVEEGGVDLAKIIASPAGAHLVVVGKRTGPFRSEVPGHISYASDAETQAMVEWLKSTNDYLFTSVRTCIGPSPLQMKCSK
jgi:hypothetical protein